MQIRRRTFLAGTLAALTTARGHAAETIKIGMVSPLTGPAAEPGRIQLNSAHLAADEVNQAGGVLGRPVELIVEDDQTTNPGAVLAFSRLANRGDCVGYIGSIRSTQMQAMAPDIARVARPVMFGGTDPTLTHSGNPWLFRCRPNDLYSARVIADFGVSDLKKRKWAVVYSTDAFGANGMKALVAALDKLGVTPVLTQGYANQQPDFTPVVLAVRGSGAEIMGSYFTYEPDQAVFARQARQLGLAIPWVGSPSIASPVTLHLAGPALFGTYGVADFNVDSSPAAKAFATAYGRAYGGAQPDNGWTYDGVHLLARAINAAGNTDPAAIRAAILATRDYQGAEGVYQFDANGDGLHGYNVVRNDKGRMTFIRHIDFPV
jgi:branched-chain amino acid transport system substrate-binding protein